MVMEMPSVEALRMVNITKVYLNGVVANHNINFSINRGEIHALSGENGAGKSTLMKILFGEEAPASGEIYVNGKKANIHSPLSAIRLGIGMVHQHFMLVPSLTVAENIVLGIEPRHGLSLDMKNAIQKTSEVAQKYNFMINPLDRVKDLTVGQKQKVEILKALIRGVNILILDEPTAVLTPQETAELFVQLKALRENGYSIIFISHKLHEVKELCSRITVIRHGEVMGVYNVDQVTEEEISKLMVGRDVVLTFDKKKISRQGAALKVKNLTILSESGKPSIDGISFTADKGEILGVAGVEGNGQEELSRALNALESFQSGSIEILGTEIRNFSVHRLRRLKIAHIPEDRMTMGTAGNMTIADNLIAGKLAGNRFSKLGCLRTKAITRFTEKMIDEYEISCQSGKANVESLSGGNIQKVVIARELSDQPQVLFADQPTRGVDVGGAEFIRKQLIRMRDAGGTVFLLSSDLDELLGISDALIVLFEGRIVAYFPDASKITEEELGRYMLGIAKQPPEQIQEAFHE